MWRLMSGQVPLKPPKVIMLLIGEQLCSWHAFTWAAARAAGNGYGRLCSLKMPGSRATVLEQNGSQWAAVPTSPAQLAAGPSCAVLRLVATATPSLSLTMEHPYCLHRYQ